MYAFQSRRTYSDSLIKTKVLDDVAPLINMLQQRDAFPSKSRIGVIPEGQIKWPWPPLRRSLAIHNIHNNLHGFVGITFLCSRDRTERLLAGAAELVVCRDRIGLEVTLAVDAFCPEGAWCNYEHLD